MLLVVLSCLAQAVGGGPFASEQVLSDDGALRSFRVDPRAGVSERDALLEIEALDLQPGSELLPLFAHPIGNAVATHYGQVHDGIEVDRGRVVIVTRDGAVIAGFIRTVDVRASSDPPHRATAAAVVAVASEGGTAGDATLHYTHDGELVWRVPVERAGGARTLVDVDAHSGRVLRTIDPRLHLTWVPATALGTYQEAAGPVTKKLAIQAEKGRASHMRLQGSPYEIAVFDTCNGGTTHCGTNDVDGVPSGLVAHDVETTSGSFTNVGPQGEFVTMFVGMHGAASYLDKNHGLDAGLPLLAYGSHSFTSPASMTWHADRNLITFDFDRMASGGVDSVYVSLDGAAHEAAHGIADLALGFPSIDVISDEEAFALAESYADIIAVAVERHVENKLNWTINEDENVLRDLSNPTAWGGAKHLDDPLFAGDSAYVRGAPHSRWFHALSEGKLASESGPNGELILHRVTGQGFDTAMDVAMGAMKMLVPDANYALAREASLVAAEEICGKGSLLVDNVERAWAMIHNGPGEPELHVEPSNLAFAIDPWPVRVRFQRFPGETAWEVEIDTTKNFDSPDYRKRPATVQQPRNGIELAGVDLPVQPGKTYFWRVRHNAPGQTTPTCERRTYRFETHENRPSPMYPLTTDSLVHPWDIEFEWALSKGAVAYTIEITDRGREYVIREKVDAEGRCEGRICQSDGIDVAQDSWMHWTVTGHGPTDLYSPNDTLESAFGRFDTLKPHALILSPSDNDGRSPWALPVQLVDLPGAAKVEVSAIDGSGEKWTFEADLETDRAQVWARPRFNDEHATLTLVAKPTGPLITPDEGEPFTDVGDTDTVEVKNLGSKTTPVLTWPVPIGEDPPAIYAGSDVTIEWQPVYGASGYDVTLYPFKDTGSSFAVDFENALYHRSVDAEETSVHIWSSDYELQIGDHVVGWWVSVTAREDVSGTLSPRKVQSTPPIDTGIVQLGEMPFLWDIPALGIDKSQLTIRDGLIYFDDIQERKIFLTLVGDPLIWSASLVRWQMHRGDCNDEVVLLHDFTSGDARAEWTRWFTMDASSLNGQMYSLKVIAMDQYGFLPDQVVCEPLRFASEEEHECGDENVNEDIGEECDDGNHTNGDGCEHNCRRPALGCGDTVVMEGGFEGHPGELFDIGVHTQAVLLYNTLDIPDALTVQVAGESPIQTGCISTWDASDAGCGPGHYVGDGTCALDIDAGALGEVTVSVNGNCQLPNSQGTRWAYQMVCPNQGGASLTPPEEP